MLELFGSGYAIDYCISAFLDKRKEELYRIYITDALKEYLHLNIRYADLFKPQETRTAKEIISRLNLDWKDDKMKRYLDNMQQVEKIKVKNRIYYRRKGKAQQGLFDGQIE